MKANPRHHLPAALALLLAFGASHRAVSASEHVFNIWESKVHVTVPQLPPGWVFRPEMSNDNWLHFYKDGDGPDYDGLWCTFIIYGESNRFENLDAYRLWHSNYERSAGTDAVHMEDSTLDGRRVFRFSATIRRPPQEKLSLGRPYTEPGFYQIDDNSVVFGLSKGGPPQAEISINIRDTCTVWLKPEQAAWVEAAFAEAKALRAGLRFRVEGATVKTTAPPVTTASNPTTPSTSIPWQVVVGIGAAGAAAIAGAAKLITGKLNGKKPDSSSVPVGYVLQLSSSSLQLQNGLDQSLKIEVWAVGAKGDYRRASNAVIDVAPTGSLVRSVSIMPQEGTGSLTCKVKQIGSEPAEGELTITARAPGAKEVSSTVHVACTGDVVMEFF